MIGPLEREQTGPTPSEESRLDRRLDGIGSGRGEDRAGRRGFGGLATRVERRQSFEQLDLDARRVHVAHAVKEGVGLGRQGRHDLGVGVSDVGDAEGGGQVDENVKAYTGADAFGVNAMDAVSLCDGWIVEAA